MDERASWPLLCRLPPPSPGTAGGGSCFLCVERGASRRARASCEVWVGVCSVSLDHLRAWACVCRLTISVAHAGSASHYACSLVCARANNNPLLHCCG